MFPWSEVSQITGFAGAARVKKRIQARIAHFLNSRDDIYIRELFKKHANPQTNLLTVDSMQITLSELGIQLNLEEMASVFEIADTDENGGLDLQEYMKAINYPCKVEQWANSLPLSKLLAHCLSFNEGDEPLKEVSRLSSDEMSAAMTAYCESLQPILAHAVRDLRRCYAEMAAVEEKESLSSSKFQTFKMSSGSVEDFHSGLHGRVGESRTPVIDG